MSPYAYEPPPDGRTPGKAGRWRPHPHGPRPQEWHVTVDASRGAEAPPELVQLLTPEGERVEHPDYDIDLTADEVKSLYRDLVLVRRVDLEAVALQRQGAAGATIVYFGDGATSQGDVNESFIWASVFNAPVVFFCQNNQWAISEPLEKQTRIPLYRRASGFGFPGVRVDGNDVFACLAVTKAALKNAREGQGPTLIEAFTYRMGAHTTTDDPTRYRVADELEAWRLKDPIERVKAYLVRTEQATKEFFDEVDAEAERVGAHVRQSCREM